MNQATLYVFAAGAFFVAGIINFVTGEVALGAAFTALGAVFTTIGSSRRKGPDVTTLLELPEAQRREVQGLVDAGRQVEAVKRVREETSAGLDEAKRYVDRLKPSRTT